MTASRFRTSQHTSEQFIESAGAILFRLSTQEVCLLHLVSRDEYIVAKGRRNLGENPQDAALREVREETGYECRLLPVTMASRTPPAVETEQSGDDVLRTYSNVTEPFFLQIRHLETKGDVKLIWWFIAAVDESKNPKNDHHLMEEKFEVEFYSYKEAVKKLTFQLDQDIVRRAIDMVTTVYH